MPGLVGELVDWITATSRRPNRVLALGAAVTVVGTLIGRRAAGPTRSATHLYAVGIAPTGSGKQHLLDSVIRLMEAAKAGGHIGPSKFFSLSAVLELLSSKPLVLCPQDEIGVFLKAVTSKRATSHEAAVSQILRALWGISFATMPTPAWAQRETQLISSPALSIFGVSTLEEFHAALQGESVANGFINRFLALTSNIRAPDRDPETDPSCVPASLSRDLQALYLWSGPESLIQIGNPSARIQPEILPWASKEANDCYTEFTRVVEDHVDEHQGSGAYLARCAETAVRLATIRAAGRWGRERQSRPFGHRVGRRRGVDGGPSPGRGRAGFPAAERTRRDDGEDPGLRPTQASREAARHPAVPQGPPAQQGHQGHPEPVGRSRRGRVARG